jgi:hypothetical protein
MKMIKLALLLIVGLYVSCLDNNKDSVTNETDLSTKDSTIKNLNPDSVIDHGSLKPIVNVSAYLIYDDGSLSAFNVINNDSVMLWNAVAGGGDVLKPSHSTKFIVTGEIDSLDIQVKKGDKLAFEKKVRGSGNKVEFVIKGTGCTEVFVIITKNKSLILNDTIPFHCGE